MTIRRDRERLFRGHPRTGRLVIRLVVVATRRRHLPQGTVRRVATSAALVVLLVCTPWALPPTGIAPAGIGAQSAESSAIATSGPSASASPSPDPGVVPPPPRTRTWPGPPGAPQLPIARERVGRALLLTFDDGPDPRFTPQVLALLKRYDARAVFCVVGHEAQQHPDLVRAIVAAGHELCNHTTSHDMDLALKPADVVRADLAATQSILRGVAGVTPRYMRSPGGRWSPSVVAAATSLGLEPLSWSVDSRDWAKPGLREIVDRVLRDVSDGGVVLMHDGGGDRSQTLVALPLLLRRLRQLGYAFR